MLGADAYETHYFYRYGPTQVLGRVWSVVELGEWFGTWTRWGDSNVFDAVWTNKNTPGEWRDEPILESIEGPACGPFPSRDERAHTATLSADGKSISDTASWYQPGWGWTGVIK